MKVKSAFVPHTAAVHKCCIKSERGYSLVLIMMQIERTVLYCNFHSFFYLYLVQGILYFFNNYGTRYLSHFQIGIKGQLKLLRLSQDSCTFSEKNAVASFCATGILYLSGWLLRLCSLKDGTFTLFLFGLASSLDIVQSTTNGFIKYEFQIILCQSRAFNTSSC